MAKCFLCGNSYRFGEDHHYDGKHFPDFRIDVCRGCDEGNHDGLADESKITKLFRHLEDIGIPLPKRNAKGCVVLR